MERVVFNVCWKCYRGPTEGETLYKVGKAEDAESGDLKTVYACGAHRGLMAQAESMRT